MIERWPSGTVDIDGAALHFARGGTGSRTIVLLHGLTDDGRCWERVAQTLADAFDIVIPDARGHGRSSGIGSGGFTVPRLAADVIGILDQLGVRDALVFGHSMGAITAAAVAAGRPDLVRALVLEDPPLDLPAASADERRGALLANIEGWRAVAVSERHALASAANPEWDRVETDPWAESKVTVDPAIVDHLDLFDGFDWRGVFDRLIAGLLLVGDPDRGAIVTQAIAREAAARWTGGRVVHVPGAGHCIHRDQWRTSMAEVVTYLREVG